MDESSSNEKDVSFSSIRLFSIPLLETLWKKIGWKLLNICQFSSIRTFFQKEFRSKFEPQTTAKENHKSEKEKKEKKEEKENGMCILQIKWGARM